MPDYRQIARDAAREAGIDPEKFVRQINQESGFNPTSRSGAGAQGIAQIVSKYHPSVDPSDPIASLHYAANWMGDLLRQYKGDWTRALVHYNGGGGAVNQWNLGRGYEESKLYVKNILGARTAEAAELDPVSNPAGGASMEQPVVPGPKPGRVAVTDGPKFIAPEPGYTDSITRDKDIYVWRRTWETGRIQEWSAPYGSTTTNDWRPMPDLEPDGRAALIWSRLVDDKLAEYKVNRAQTGQPVYRETIVKEPGQRVANGQILPPRTIKRTSKITTDAAGKTVVTPLFDLDEEVTTDKQDYITGPGGEIFQILPGGALKSVAGITPTITTINGVAGRVGTDNKFTPVTGGPPSWHFIGNHAVAAGADGRLTVTTIDPAAEARAAAAEGRAVAGEGRSAASAALNDAKTALEIKKLENELIPLRQRVLKDHDTLVNDLAAKYRRGDITREQADAFFKATSQTTLAAMQGTSPEAIATMRERAEANRRNSGVSLLNQRVSSGGALAQNLITTASSMAEKAMFRPGQTSFGVDPLAIAQAWVPQFIDTLGGGKATGDFARELVTSAAPMPPGLIDSDASALFTAPWQNNSGMGPGVAPTEAPVTPTAPVAPGAPEAPLAPGQVPPGGVAPWPGYPGPPPPGWTPQMYAPGTAGRNAP